MIEISRFAEQVIRREVVPPLSRFIAMLKRAGFIVSRLKIS
jgi:hypothetical protein